MGSFASRIARGPKHITKPVWPESLRNVPETSAVRRDAEAAFAIERRRIDMESSSVNYEELNKKDEEIVSLMKKTMTLPEGTIVYREHILPLADNQMVQDMVQQVKSEQLSTEECYAARDASEQDGCGRVTHEQFISIMKQIQANRGDRQLITHLSSKFKCNEKTLEAVAKHCSVPSELNTVLGSTYSRVASWQ